MIWYLNFKLDLILSCAKDFQNLNSMVTWCINWKRLLAPIILQRSSLTSFLIIKRLAITLMYCNRLHAWWSNQSWLATLLFPLIARWWDGLQTLWWFLLKDLSIDEMVGAWYFICLSGPAGLPVGSLLLWYSVLFTFKSLSLLHRLVISWFVLSWSTSELRVRLAPLNRFKPSIKIFYWPFQGGTSFVDLYVFFCLVFAMPLLESVYMCLVVTCWERVDLLALVCCVQLWVCHFPIGILGQVWYLIVLIPDLCTLTYFSYNSRGLFLAIKFGYMH